MVPCGDVVLPVFCTDGSDVGARWKKWVRSFKLLASGRGVQNPVQKRDLFLGLAGEGVQDIFETLPVPVPADGDGGDGDEFTRALAVLDAYFAPQVNVPFERSVFRRCDMSEGESVMAYITRLRRLAASCEFPNEGDSIRDQVIEKIRSSRLRRKLLEEGGQLTLERLMVLARADEAMNQQVHAMGGAQTADSVLRVRQGSGKPVSRKSNPGHNGGTGSQRQRGAGNQRQSPHSKREGRQCFRCGREGHLAASSECSARQQTCRTCHRKGHFSGTVYCKGQRPTRQSGVGTLQNSDDSDDNTLFTVSDGKYDMFRIGRGNSARVNLLLNGKCMSVLVDSGACANLLDKQTAEALKKTGLRVQPTERKLHAYGAGGKPIDLCGEMTIPVAVARDVEPRDCLFYVYNGTATTLVGFSDSQALGVLHVKGCMPSSGNEVCSLKDVCMKDFPECFSGLGKLKVSPIGIHVNPDVNPVSQPPRRIPFGYQDKVKAKLTELSNLGVIEAVEGPTGWVSPLVVVPKDNGEVRLCVDMRRANEAVIRERHPMPSIKELLQNLNGARVFSKVDLNLGFHQCELDETSRGITTFSTPWGLYRYRRLMFGVASAPEVYQHTLRKALVGLEGVQNYSDDIIVHGKDQEEHDQRLRALMVRAKELGMTLNSKKCEFGLTEIDYLGFRVSANGIAMSPKKVEVIRTAREPRNTREVAGFLGLVKWVGKFLPNLSTVAEPLMHLCRDNRLFSWGEEQKKAFNDIKKMVGDVKTLAYFDARCETFVVADASPHGLGAVLYQIQDGVSRVVEYAHRSLTSVERRYSQSEREALALVYACEHFFMYLAGHHFTLITDHKPLQHIFGKTSSKPTPRLERWALRLMAFNYTIRYEPGPTNIADPLSRLATVSQGYPTPTEAYVRVVAAEACPSAVSWEEVQKASLECPEIESVKRSIRSDDWKESLAAYRANRLEFCECDEAVMRGSRLVVPVSLRDRFMKLAHEGHQGTVKTKQRLRSYAWWPGMDKGVERLCRTCFECQLVAQPDAPEPIVSTRLPEQPWEHLAMDLMGPLPNGEHVLVVVDYYSRYYEVGFMRSTVSKKIIEFCESVFSRWGLPKSIRTDNGPQFASAEFQEYLKQENIRWVSTTPLWPRANGEVERQNRSILKSLKLAASAKKDYKAELRKYLVAYRSTPHSTTGVSPFELMTGRKMRTRLSTVDSVPAESQMHSSTRDADALAKLKAKKAADRQRGARDSVINPGDTVLVDAKRAPKNKLSTTFEKEPYTVKARQGSEVICGNEQHELRRNVAVTRKITSPEVDAGTERTLTPPEVQQTNPPSLPSTPCRPKRNTKPPAWMKDYGT